MLRPESWSRLAGGSPVRVGTGVPGSGPRFVAERRRAERGVKSLFGGSKRAGRSIRRTLQPRQVHNGGAEPLMSRRRPCLPGPVPGSAWRVLPGYGGRHVRTVWAGTGETRLPGLRQAKTAEEGLGLRLHPDKTKAVDLREGREGLDFLGCHFHARMSGRLWEQKRIVRYYLHRWPGRRLRGGASSPPRRGPKTGSTGTACTGSAAPSATRGQRNHVKKIIGKPYAGKPHVRN